MAEPVDARASIEELQARLRAFAQARDWGQFHSPKNLAMALVVEAGELVEQFQWLTEQQSAQLTAEQLAAVRHELADVLIYLVRLADVLQVKIGPQGMERLRAFRKIANQHVGFVVCDRDMTIIAIVDAKEPDQVIDPRDQKLETIKQRCLQAAQVKYICIYPPQLPRYRELREQILGPAGDLV